MDIKISVALLIICLSCSGKKIEGPKLGSKDPVSISQMTSNYDSLIFAIKIKGDTDAYDELFYGFMDSNKTERIDSVIIYSKIMAEKYNYGHAYFHYLTALFEKEGIKADYSDFNKINLNTLSDSSTVLANAWLQLMVTRKIITQEEYDLVKR